MNQTSSRWPREFITSSEPRSMAMPQMRPHAHTAYHLIKAPHDMPKMRPHAHTAYHLIKAPHWLLIARAQGMAEQGISG